MPKQKNNTRFKALVGFYVRKPFFGLVRKKVRNAKLGCQDGSKSLLHVFSPWIRHFTWFRFSLLSEIRSPMTSETSWERDLHTTFKSRLSSLNKKLPPIPKCWSELCLLTTSIREWCLNETKRSWLDVTLKKHSQKYLGFSTNYNEQVASVSKQWSHCQ